MKFNLPIFITLITSSALLLGCGGSSDSDSTPEQDNSVVFNLAVSDAPVDDALSVVACFNEIELKGNSNNIDNNIFIVGETEGTIAANNLCTDDSGNVVPNTVGIDLLQYSGSAAISLVSDVAISVGNYTQMRLSMLPYSYAIVDNEGTLDRLPVRVPSNELKLDGFTATVGNTVDFTLEFDLRKGMTDPVGQEGWILKPRGVRLVDNNLAGHIEGSIDELLLTAENNCVENDAFVYLYSGFDLIEADLADLDGSELHEPITSMNIVSEVENQGPYSYEIGYVSVGDYTLALTCETDQVEIDDDVSFIKVIETSVVEKQTSKADFTL